MCVLFSRGIDIATYSNVRAYLHLSAGRDRSVKLLHFYERKVIAVEASHDGNRKNLTCRPGFHFAVLLSNEKNSNE